MGAGGVGGGHPRGEGREDSGKESGPQGPAWVCRDHRDCRAASTPPASTLCRASWAPRRPLQTAAHTSGTWPPQALSSRGPGSRPLRGPGEQEAEGALWPATWHPPVDIPSPGPRHWVDGVAPAQWAPLPGMDTRVTTTDICPCSGVSPGTPAVGMTSAVSSTAVTDAG